MFKKELSMKDLIKRLEAMGLIAYANDGGNVVTVVFSCMSSDFEVGSGIEQFVGATPMEIFEKVVTWKNDKSQWLDLDRYLVLSPEKNPYDINLEEELLELGFKSVDVELEDTNFVAVDCRFCYIDELGEFKYDGVLQFDNIGDKFTTLMYIKTWINRFASMFPDKKFAQCRNKERY